MIQEIKKFKVTCDHDKNHFVIVEAEHEFYVIQKVIELYSWKEKAVEQGFAFRGMTFVSKIFCPECIQKV